MIFPAHGMESHTQTSLEKRRRASLMKKRPWVMSMSASRRLESPKLPRLPYEVWHKIIKEAGEVFFYPSSVEEERDAGAGCLAIYELVRSLIYLRSINRVVQGVLEDLIIKEIRPRLFRLLKTYQGIEYVYSFHVLAYPALRWFLFDRTSDEIPLPPRLFLNYLPSAGTYSYSIFELSNREPVQWRMKLLSEDGVLLTTPLSSWRPLVPFEIAHSWKPLRSSSTPRQKGTPRRSSPHVSRKSKRPWQSI